MATESECATEKCCAGNLSLKLQTARSIGLRQRELMMQIKRPLIKMMTRDFPEFRSIESKRPFYIFRRESPRGLFDYIKFEYDGEAGALAVSVHTTYDPNWDLGPPPPIGADASLVALKKGTWLYDAGEEWYNFGKDKGRLEAILIKLTGDLATYGQKFFRDAAETLESNQVLQYGLNLVRESGPLSRSELARLEHELRSKRGRSWELTDQRLERLKQSMRDFAGATGASKEQRRAISPMATQLICLQPDKLT